jgi:hypothetical protein
MMCHADEQTAIDRGLDGGHFFGFSLGHYYVFGTHRPGVTNVWDEFQAKRSLFGFDRGAAARIGEPLGAQVRGGGGPLSLRGAVGTPAQLEALVAGYEAVGVDQLIFVSQAGRNRHEHICESLELFAKQVMPRFQANEAERERRKLARLEPALAAALARREPPRKLASGYEMRAAMKP